jgi:hypothetical protein
LFKRLVGTNKRAGSLPLEALVDPNEFREQRLYTPLVDKLVWQHRPLLETCWRKFKSKDQGMTLPQW